YQCAFRVSAVLLVWPERNQILRVEFPRLQPRTVDNEAAAAALIEVGDQNPASTKSPWRLAACSLVSLVLAGLLLQL
ncbi:MAG TPA: hypothetical protein PLF40_12250, partial [Kofleriaceae bacterium]|nr:hypothetical protein [Kofleriaceae bacterium]